MPNTISIKGRAEKRFLKSFPLGYLTSLFLPYVHDATSIRSYIIPSLAEAADQAVEYILTDADERLDISEYRALAKEMSLTRVYLNPSSAQLKRDLFNVPIDDFFDICVQSLRQWEATDVNFEELAHWIAGCAIHPEADTNKSLGPLLGRYGLRFPAPLNWHSEQEVMLTNEFRTTYSTTLEQYPEMAETLLTIAIFLPSGDLVQAIQHFVQFAMNMVDVWIVYENSPEPRDDVLQVALDCVYLAWNNMLDAPFSGLSCHLRYRLSLMNIDQHLLKVMNNLLRRSRLHKTRPAVLHFMLWQNTLQGIAQINSYRISKDLFRSTVASNFDFPSGEYEDIPEYYRPAKTVDQVTTLLNAHIRPWADEAMKPVPIKAIGCTNDPHDLGSLVLEAPANDRCTICQDDFSDPANDFMSLKTCGHVFHYDCVYILANRVSIGVTAIQCPNCRVRLCDARDYQAVLES